MEFNEDRQLDPIPAEPENTEQIDEVIHEDAVESVEEIVSESVEEIIEEKIRHQKNSSFSLKKLLSLYLYMCKNI